VTEPAPAIVPRAEKDLSSDYREPATATQHTLVRVWREHLHVDPVGLDDDFFELGGHSLLAAELLVATELAVGVHVSARTLYLEPTIAALAAEIDRRRSEEGAPA